MRELVVQIPHPLYISHLEPPAKGQRIRLTPLNKEAARISTNVTQSIKQLTKQTLVYGVGNVLTRLITFLLLPLFTNVLSPEEYGLTTLLYVFLGFMNVIYHYGLDAAFMRFYSDARDNAAKDLIFSTSLWLGLVTSTFFSTLIIISASQLSLFLLGGENYDNLIRLSAVILFFDALSHIPFALLRLKERSFHFMSIKFLNVVITLGLNIYLVLVKGMGLHGVFLSLTIASTFTTLAALLTSTNSIHFVISRNVINSLLSFGLPFLPAGFASIAMESLDRYILAGLTDASTVGIYSAGYKLGIFMLLLTTAFQYAWQPFFLKLGNRPESKPIFASVFTHFMVIVLFV